MRLALARGGLVLDGERRRVDQVVRFQETLRRLAIFDEKFVEAGCRPGLAGPSALDAKTTALLQVAVSVAIQSSAGPLLGLPPIGGVARQSRDVSICRGKVVQARLACSALACSALTSGRRRRYDRAL